MILSTLRSTLRSMLNFNFVKDMSIAETIKYLIKFGYEMGKTDFENGTMKSYDDFYKIISKEAAEKGIKTEFLNMYVKAIFNCEYRERYIREKIEKIVAKATNANGSKELYEIGMGAYLIHIAKGRKKGVALGFLVGDDNGDNSNVIFSSHDHYYIDDYHNDTDAISYGIFCAVRSEIYEGL